MNQPRITFLDISTMDAGDIDFSPLGAIGKFESFPSTAPQQVVERLAQSDVAIVNKVVLGRAEISACPNLKLIQISATGCNNIDLDAARDHDITVCNISGYSSDTVAQHTIGLLLNLATSIHRLANETASWCDSPIFTRLDYPATELADKTLGLVGSGEIGGRVADIAEALGMRVQFLARPGSLKISGHGHPRVEADEFFSSSDAISLHCPLTAENRHMINAHSLAKMKPGAFLINTGRGDLVDEQALAEALENKTIAGAGLDVLSQEPPPGDHPLIQLSLNHPECLLVITPHSAWTSTEARTRLLDGMVDNIKAWKTGWPNNVVS